MSEEAASAWQDFCSALDDLSSRLSKVDSVHVNSVSLRGATREASRLYFRRVRPQLDKLDLGDHVQDLDTALQNLLQLSAGRNVVSSYRKHTKAVRKLLPKVTGLIELQVGGGKRSKVGLSKDDVKIIETLARLVVSAAASYQQAIADLADERRISFKGLAHELREVLREVLDHFAPNAEVVASEGFKFEENLTKPTMRQKVRFILGARGRSKKDSAAPEDTTAAVEAMVAELTRTVYNVGAAAAHIAQERARIVKLKRYVDVVLLDILEI
jgi:hypothetical protein